MTLKDYIAIAEAFGQEYSRYSAQSYPTTWTERRDAIETLARVLASTLEDDNPRFDREFFLQVVRGERELNSRPPQKVGA